MPDDLSTRHGRDRERINVNQDHELRHWSQKLGVTPDKLKEAVQAVGDDAEKVQQHLRKSVSDSAASRSTQAPGRRSDHAGSGNTMGDGRGSSGGGRGGGRSERS